MKKTKIAYWIFTGLLAASMLISSIPSILRLPSSVAMISTLLGYPAYIVPFLGVAKLLAAVVIIIPGFPRLKEWAYAGITFDLVGATYSQIAISTPVFRWIFMIIWFIPLVGSYIYYHKITRAEVLATSTI
jgi:hypothetical protein